MNESIYPSHKFKENPPIFKQLSCTSDLFFVIFNLIFIL
jgi:hypothetical protein